MSLAAVSLLGLYFLGCIERGTGTFVNLQDFEEESDIYDLEPWDPSASMPWSFLYSSFTPEPSYWDVSLPWGVNPYDPEPMPPPEPPLPSNEDYCDLDSDHIMCEYQGPTDECLATAERRELNEDDITLVVDKINEVRSIVATGQEETQPPAANMQKLEWSRELGALAQRIADKLLCDSGLLFTGLTSMEKIDGTPVGWSVASNGWRVPQTDSQLQDAMDSSVEGWYDEFVSTALYGDQSPERRQYTGEVRQIVWADTTEVGCGQAYFLYNGGYGFVMVCTFAEGSDSVGEPFQPGDTCSECDYGQTCDQGLCY